MWSDHRRLEERSIALHLEIAKRIEANPGIISIAKKNLERWIKKDGELPVWREWREILGRPMDQILALLISPDENVRRLRQSSPFCGVLSPRERWKIYESFTVGTYYQSSREHR